MFFFQKKIWRQQQIKTNIWKVRKHLRKIPCLRKLYTFCPFCAFCGGPLASPGSMQQCQHKNIVSCWSQLLFLRFRSHSSTAGRKSNGGSESSSNRRSSKFSSSPQGCRESRYMPMYTVSIGYSDPGYSARAVYSDLKPLDGGQSLRISNGFCTM